MVMADALEKKFRWLGHIVKKEFDADSYDDYWSELVNGELDYCRELIDGMKELLEDGIGANWDGRWSGRWGNIQDIMNNMESGLGLVRRGFFDLELGRGDFNALVSGIKWAKSVVDDLVAILELHEESMAEVFGW